MRIKSPPAATHANTYDEQSLSTFRGMISQALGADRIDALSKRQSGLLERSLSRLFEQKPLSVITLDEIVGCYEIVTEHMSPLWMEAVVSGWNERQKLN